MNEILIRPETSADHKAVRDLIVEVFYETYETGEDEANLVEELRKIAQPNTHTSLIAEINGELAGHIFFSAVQLQEHPQIPISVLAPLGVYKQYQRQGIGTQLIQSGLKACTDQGYKLVVVQGSLQYYPRFGFIPIDKTQLHTIFNSDHDMVLELEPGILNSVSGLVDYPKLWHALL